MDQFHSTFQTVYISSCDTPCGTIILGGVKDTLCLCDWQCRRDALAFCRRLQNRLSAVPKESETPVIVAARSQIDQYFTGARTRFDLPITIAGTALQMQVWRELLTVPYGNTISYRELAERVGRPRAVRAVANAVGANPLSLFVPCHRVIGSDGTLTGYAGGLETKRYLLQLEQKITTPLG